MYGLKIYAAHLLNATGKNNSAAEVQTVAEHLQNVSAIMGKNAEGMGVAALARLIGILHDLGKSVKRFRDTSDIILTIRTRNGLVVLSSIRQQAERS